MFTEAQNLFLCEVLGVNPNHFIATSVAQPHEPATTVVMTGELGPEESALLNKILSSLRLTDYVHIAGHQDVNARHVLVFGGALAEGRHQLGHSTWWSMPSLESMLGNDHSVLERKKNTWNLLQTLVKELA